MKKFSAICIVSVALFWAFPEKVCAVSYYECGLYAGVQGGWALIDSPKCNDYKSATFGFRSKKIESCRGCFTWGVHGGYNYPLYCDFFLGAEAGYHDNGFSLITFLNGNEYRVESSDVELLATATYMWFPGIWLNAKVGAARLRQVYRIWHVADNCNIDATAVVKEWTPTTTLSIGYNFCNFDIYIAYRYVFGHSQKRLSNLVGFRRPDQPFPKTFYVRDQIARVNAIYVGLQASIY